MRALARVTFLQERVAALFLIRGKIGCRLPRVRVRLGRHGRGNFVGRGIEGLHMANGGCGRMIARAHARRAHDAHVRPQLARQFRRAVFRRRASRTTASRHTRTVTGGGGVSPSFTTSK